MEVRVKGRGIIMEKKYADEDLRNILGASEEEFLDKTGAWICGGRGGASSGIWTLCGKSGTGGRDSCPGKYF